MVRGQLRDKARIIRKTKSATRTEGGYKTTDVPGPWFRCHYAQGDESEARSDGGVRRHRAGPQVVTHRLALDGSTIDVKAEDEIEIDSRTHGVFRAGITGAPLRMHKGRIWIGWLIDVAKTNRKAPG
jgi:hypothetical protein